MNNAREHIRVVCSMNTRMFRSLNPNVFFLNMKGIIYFFKYACTAWITIQIEQSYLNEKYGGRGCC